MTSTPGRRSTRSSGRKRSEEEVRVMPRKKITRGKEQRVPPIPANALGTARDRDSATETALDLVNGEQGDLTRGRGGGSSIKRSKGKGRAPAFEVIVLGSGGGPLETDISGYLVKPAQRSWEDGFVAIEGGSGIGSLANLMESTDNETLFPGLILPTDHNTPVLKAAYVFSFLTCYLLTHAHFDHCSALVLSSGSLPPRRAKPASPRVPASTGQEPSASGSSSKGPSPAETRSNLPVYGTVTTLQKFYTAYNGELWPELVGWDDHGRKALKTIGHDDIEVSASETEQPAVLLTPLKKEVSASLDPNIPLQVRLYEISHGTTSKGDYDSTAVFIRFDSRPPAPSQSPGPNMTLTPPPTASTSTFEIPDMVNGAVTENETESSSGGSEFLFFGDVESSYRPEGAVWEDEERRIRVEECNAKVWTEAANSWVDGRLRGIFIECSYDRDRPTEMMFGHMSPQGVLHELKILADMVTRLQLDSGGASTIGTTPPLQSLPVYITHIKEDMIPHPSGQSASQRIIRQLRDMSLDANSGVEFSEVKRGMRILL